MLGDRPLDHVPQLEDALRASSLRSAGIEAVIPIRSGRLELGLVLLAGDPRAQPCADPELEFFALIANQAGTALHNAQLTQRLLVNERHASTGRVAVVLAHDMGKELDWVGRLVKRLPKRLDDRERLERDISMIREFTDGLLDSVRRFVRDATESALEPPGFVRFDEMVEGAVWRVTRMHGPDRVTACIDPAVRRLRIHENLNRAVVNLLDNALQATAEPDPVQLFATLERQWIRIVVLDSGAGIPADIRPQIFTPGFSTRLDQGGSGIGLTVAREIVESLGGSIELTDAAEGGTRATVRVPVTH